MSAARLAWPGVALAITLVDDFVAGPLLAATGAWVGGQWGVMLGVVAFTVLVGALVGSTVLTSRDLGAGVRARVDRAVAAASKRPFVGRFVAHMGDDHLWSTAAVATVISPVLAVLLARMVHPGQRLVRTSVVAVSSYGLAFALFYTGLGSLSVASL